MGVLSWLYTNNVKKNIAVKIVHPGGHAELHGNPVLAAEIIRRNPRCCVAHPNVFQQPWAIVPPHTTLMPGQKFYVVPISTIRKLQRLSLKYNPSSLVNQESPKVVQGDDNDDDDDDDSFCCSFGVSSTTPKSSYHCLKSSDEEWQKRNKNCFTCFFKGIKKRASGEDSSKEARLSVSETKGVAKNCGSPKRHGSLDHWEPNLESIVEELNTPSVVK